MCVLLMLVIDVFYFSAAAVAIPALPNTLPNALPALPALPNAIPALPNAFLAFLSALLTLTNALSDILVFLLQ